MTLRAVLFDLDGTLVDSAHGIAAALSSVREARGEAKVSAARVRPWISLGAAELVRRGLGSAGGSLEDDLREFRRVLSALPTPPDSLYPGVRELLDGLRASSLSLAIVTNKPETLARGLLRDLDLHSAFGAVVGGDSVATCKPDPAPSLAALHALGRTAEEAAFVGDSLIDAQAAGALGLPFHLFTQGYGAAECEGQPVATRFSRHLALLRTLGSAAVQAETPA